MSQASTPTRSDLRDQPLLPEAFVSYAKRRGFEAAGFVLVAIGIAGLAALMSYDPADPSLNHATERAAHNLLGSLGAMYADLSLQALGLASALLPICLLSWGARLMAKQPVHRISWRVGVALLSSAFFAVSLQALTPPTTWPILTGLGGTVGWLAMTPLADALTSAGLAMAPLAIAAVGFLIALVALIFATGLSLHESRVFGVAIIAGLHHTKVTFRNGLRFGGQALRERAEPWFEKPAPETEFRLGVAVGAADDDNDAMIQPRALETGVANTIIERSQRIATDKAVAMR